HDHLLPNREFSSDLMEICGWNRQSSGVGGDYFGLFQSPRGPLVAIGDSTGHGVGAALLMVTARAYLRGAVESQDAPVEQLLTILKRLLTPDMDSGLFVSMLNLRFEEDGQRIRYSTAGHEPPLIYRSATG